MLIEKANRHLKGGLTYITLLPRIERHIRLSCIWPLLFAVKTLALSRNNHNVLESETKITRNQVKSISENLKESYTSDYSILKSRAFRDSLALLNDSERLVVEKQINELLTTLSSHHAETTSQTNLLNLRELSNPLGIYYQVDGDNNQVKLVSLQEIPNE